MFERPCVLSSLNAKIFIFSVSEGSKEKYND